MCPYIKNQGFDLWNKCSILLYSVLSFNHDCEVTHNWGVYLAHIEDTVMDCPKYV